MKGTAVVYDRKTAIIFLMLFKLIFLSPDILLEVLYNPGKIIYKMHSKDIAKLCLLIYRAVSEFDLKRYMQYELISICLTGKE